MSVWIALAFALGLLAGAFLVGLIMLVFAIHATRRRQQHLDALIAGGRR